MVKPIRRSLARRMGRNIGDRRRAIGLTQEQLAEYIEIARPDRVALLDRQQSSSTYSGGHHCTPARHHHCRAADRRGLVTLRTYREHGHLFIQPVHGGPRLIRSDFIWLDTLLVSAFRPCQPIPYYSCARCPASPLKFCWSSKGTRDLLFVGMVKAISILAY